MLPTSKDATNLGYPSFLTFQPLSDFDSVLPTSLNISSQQFCGIPFIKKTPPSPLHHRVEPLGDELYHTLLSCSSSDAEDFSEEGPGLSNCASESDPTMGACIVSRNSPVQDPCPEGVYFQTPAQIFRQATGRYRPEDFLQDPTSSTSFLMTRPLSPEFKLAARLNLFIIRLNEFMSMKERMNQGSGLTDDDRIQATLWCLGYLGFQLHAAHLCPSLALYKHLETHKFWILIPPDHLCPNTWSGAQNDQLFVLDFHFTGLFQVARPTESFEYLFHRLRNEFVGTAYKDLPEAIAWVGKYARRSLEDRGLEVPPWRQTSFLQSCFIHGVERFSKSIPYQFIEVSTGAMWAASSFLASNSSFLKSIRFVRKVAPQPPPKLSPRVTPVALDDPLEFSKDLNPQKPDQKEGEGQLGQLLLQHQFSQNRTNTEKLSTPSPKIQNEDSQLCAPNRKLAKSLSIPKLLFLQPLLAVVSSLVAPPQDASTASQSKKNDIEKVQ